MRFAHIYKSNLTENLVLHLSCTAFFQCREHGGILSAGINIHGNICRQCSIINCLNCQNICFHKNYTTYTANVGYVGVCTCICMHIYTHTHHVHAQDILSAWLHNLIFWVHHGMDKILNIILSLCPWICIFLDTALLQLLNSYLICFPELPSK